MPSALAFQDTIPGHGTPGVQAHSFVAWDKAPASNNPLGWDEPPKPWVVSLSLQLGQELLGENQS